MIIRISYYGIIARENSEHIVAMLASQHGSSQMNSSRNHMLLVSETMGTNSIFAQIHSKRSRKQSANKNMESSLFPKILDLGSRYKKYARNGIMRIPHLSQMR